MRLVHLGLGSFFRAHQAWYTAHASDASGWGYAAFTGRRPDIADALSPQDGLYTLLVRHPDGDAADIVGSVAEVHPASNHAAYLELLRRPEVAVVTITLTESAYLVRDGHLDVADPALVADLEALRADLGAPVSTLPARLLSGLAARRAAGGGPITVLPCDNLPHNGTVARTGVLELAALVEDGAAGGLAAWVGDHVDFASSMVDRITPATTDDDVRAATAATGLADAAPVPTEPFTEWVLSGAFPAGRPAWESAGALVVDDVTPYEQRKLWLLNGSHSLLAYSGPLRGHSTVDEAIADPTCRAWVEEYWDEACRHLPMPAAELRSYREALLGRYSNPRVRHLLAQIASDGSVKLPVRIVPTLLAERAAGRMPVGAARAVAAWIWHLRGRGAPVKDSGAEAAAAAARAGEGSVAAVLALLRPALSADQALVELVTEQLDALA
ncbi:mannitol dehydrogenase family protein [Quadrisphaera granulorum]|uniref:mannitol dehydrogenase family protein n=1 Tax=Quadrisphaera granulorum TaxID=317664 RepID=UPI001B874C95|nr:mannitol dehydrogenase family protein [Quadrisphaera granulorum]